MSFTKMHSAGYLANHFARLMAVGLQRRLKPLGLAPAQFMVLLELWERDGQTQAELVVGLDVEQATMANTLSRMERDELVTRDPSDDDKRVKIIRLTERAKKLRVPAQKAAYDQNMHALSDLDENEQFQLVQLMQRTVSTLKRR
nr:MarR family transcriptional regulator [uncultured Shimia sp.]